MTSISNQDYSMEMEVVETVEADYEKETGASYTEGMPKEKAFGILSKEAADGKLDRNVVKYLLEFADKE